MKAKEQPEEKKKKKKFTWKDYYVKHRDRLNAQKRERYQQDKAYRKAMLKRSQKAYEEYRKKHPLQDRRCVVGDKGEVFVTIGELARIINRDQTAIRRYHKQKLLPVRVRYDSRGWRIYSLDDVELLKRAFDALHKRKIKNLRDIKSYIREQLKS